jgi:hypothetical protein
MLMAHQDGSELIGAYIQLFHGIKNAAHTDAGIKQYCCG